MYVKIKTTTTRPIIDITDTARLTPIITSVQKKNDKEGNENINLNVKYYCSINKQAYIESGCEKIDVFLSPEPIEFFREKSSEGMATLLKDYLKQNNLEITLTGTIEDYLKQNNEMNTAIVKYTATLKRQVISSLFKKFNVKKLSSISANDNQLATNKKIVFLKNKKNNDLRNNSSLVDSTFKNARKKFKKNYTSLLKQGVDPLFLFENPYKKSSQLLNRQGSKIKTPLKLNGFSKYLEDVYSTIVSDISTLSNSTDQYSKRSVIENRALLEGNFFISNESLKELGNNCFLLFYAKDKNGINLLANSLYLDVEQILSQISQSSLDYSIGAGRNKNTGVSKLLIGNNSQTDKLSVTVYAKELQNFGEQKLIFKKAQENLEVPSNSSIKVSDGKLTNTSFASTFSDGKNILYRTTINFNKTNFDNAKTNFTKSTRFRYQNVPSCTLTTKVRQNTISIEASNISSNVTAVRLRKYRYSASIKGSKKFTIDESGQPQKFFKILKEKQNILFEDFDVFDGKHYEYELECEMENGEIKKAVSNPCIEHYEKRQDIIAFDIRKKKRTRNVGSEVINGVQTPVDRIQFTFAFKRRIPQFEKIIKSFLPRSVTSNFDISSIFKELSSIRNFSYSFLVERFDKLTGDSFLLDTIITDEESIDIEINIEDTVSALSNVYYKLTPRIKPTKDLLETIQNMAQDLAANSRFATVNYSQLQAEKARRSISENILSVVNNKFNAVNALKRGLIIPESISNANSASDLFFDSSTGDIEYVAFNNVQKVSAKNIKINFESCDEIKTVSKEDSRLIRQNNQKNKIQLRDRKFDLRFSVNKADSDIDFYIIFIKNGDQTYLDGVIHSRDQTSSNVNVNKYAYLVQLFGTEGVVEYYVVPVSKKGDLLAPRLITKKLIN